MKFIKSVTVVIIGVSLTCCRDARESDFTKTDTPRKAAQKSKSNTINFDSLLANTDKDQLIFLSFWRGMSEEQFDSALLYEESRRHVNLRFVPRDNLGPISSHDGFYSFALTDRGKESLDVRFRILPQFSGDSLLYLELNSIAADGDWNENGFADQVEDLYKAKYGKPSIELRNDPLTQSTVGLENIITKAMTYINHNKAVIIERYLDKNDRSVTKGLNIQYLLRKNYDSSNEFFKKRNETELEKLKLLRERNAKDI
jgi:hypothetical protein